MLGKTTMMNVIRSLHCERSAFLCQIVRIQPRDW